MNEIVIKYCKPFLWVGLVALVLWVFCPTTKQGYMIYGLGNTIDYIKSNDTAKQLPDKVVLALDKFLEEEINDTDNKDKKDE